MSDLRELTDYVSEHPDAYDYRWRLAKKLYMAWEYKEALKHLLVLKSDWTRHLNVLRYLAATYYRLGRYEEAIQELEEILRQWPGEIPVWEQYARVSEVAGRTEAAIVAWEEVLKLDPDHSIAGRAVLRLRSTPDNSSREELNLADSDSGINLSAAHICENCGAQNSEEFDRCWQCHALLAHAALSSSVQTPLPESSSKAWLRTLVGGLLTVAAVSACVYLSLAHLPNSMGGTGTEEVPLSVYAVLAETLYSPG